MRNDQIDHAALLREAISHVEGVERVEATFRRSGPISSAQSVVNIHTSSTDAATLRHILTRALTQCAHVLAPVPIRGTLHLYCFDGDGVRHALEEIDEDLSVAISFDRLAAWEGLERR